MSKRYPPNTLPHTFQTFLRTQNQHFWDSTLVVKMGQVWTLAMTALLCNATFCFNSIWRNFIGYKGKLNVVVTHFIQISSKNGCGCRAWTVVNSADQLVEVLGPDFRKVCKLNLQTTRKQNCTCQMRRTAGVSSFMNMQNACWPLKTMCKVMCKTQPYLFPPSVIDMWHNIGHCLQQGQIY